MNRIGFDLWCSYKLRKDIIVKDIDKCLSINDLYKAIQKEMIEVLNLIKDVGGNREPEYVCTFKEEKHTRKLNRFKVAFHYNGYLTLIHMEQQIENFEDLAFREQVKEIFKVMTLMRFKREGIAIHDFLPGNIMMERPCDCGNMLTLISTTSYTSYNNKLIEVNYNQYKCSKCGKIVEIHGEFENKFNQALNYIKEMEL